MSLAKDKEIFGTPLLSNKEAEEALFLSIAQKYNISEDDVYYIWMNQWKSLNKYISNNPDKCHTIEITDLIKIKTTINNLPSKVYGLEKICKRYLSESRTLDQRLNFIGYIEKTIIFIKKCFEVKIEERKQKDLKSRNKGFITDKHKLAIDEYQGYIRRLEELTNAFQTVKEQNKRDS